MSELIHDLEIHRSSEPIENITFKKRAEDIKNQFLPHIETINKLRKKYQNKEIGGFILKGKLKLLEESKWKENEIIGESYEEERKSAEKGAISFHTHPLNDRFTQESAQDILSCYYRFNEVIFGVKSQIIILIAKKNLSIEKIQEIDKKAWEKANNESDAPYWTWKGILTKKLPIYTKVVT